jgi:hypothetical protein
MTSFIYDFNLSNIKTGDLLLFSRKSFKSNTTRFFTASRWNHVGIAVLVPKGKGDSAGAFDPENPKLDFSMDSGELHIMELVDRTRACFRCIPYDHQLKHYRCIAYRPLKPEYRKAVKENIGEFYRRHHDVEYMSVMDQINMLLGSPFTSKGRERGYSCTMIANKFLNDALGAPKTLYTLPGSYDSKEASAHDRGIADLYYGEEIGIHVDHEDWGTVIGSMLVYLLVYLLFWYLTSNWFF